MDGPPLCTFSIVGADPAQKELGVAVASRFLAVGAVVAFAEAGVGAIATQSFANTSYGPKALKLLKRRMHPRTVLARLTRPDRGRDERQVGIVDARGRAATYTGRKCYRWAGGLTGPDFAAQGNILTGGAVVEEMAEAFAVPAPLAQRLYAALRAGDRTGGDRRGKQSAAILVVRRGAGYGGFDDRLMDLRVDDHKRPVEELGRLMHLHTLTFVKATDFVPIEGRLKGDVEAALRRLGYRGPRALADFHHRENFEMRLGRRGTIDRGVLAALRRMARVQ